MLRRRFSDNGVCEHIFEFQSTGIISKFPAEDTCADGDGRGALQGRVKKGGLL